jgi:hypothetical protein
MFHLSVSIQTVRSLPRHRGATGRRDRSMRPLASHDNARRTSGTSHYQRSPPQPYTQRPTPDVPPQRPVQGLARQAVSHEFRSRHPGFSAQSPGHSPRLCGERGTGRRQGARAGSCCFTHNPCFSHAHWTLRGHFTQRSILITVPPPTNRRRWGLQAEHTSGFSAIPGASVTRAACDRHRIAGMACE